MSWPRSLSTSGGSVSCLSSDGRSSKTTTVIVWRSQISLTTDGCGSVYAHGTQAERRGLPISQVQTSTGTRWSPPASSPFRLSLDSHRHLTFTFLPSHDASAHAISAVPRFGKSDTVAALFISSKTSRFSKGQPPCPAQTPSSKFSMVRPPSRPSLPHAAGLKLADVTRRRRELPRLSEYTLA